MRKFVLAAAAVVGLVLCASSVRAEDMENPEYANWKGFKPGSSVTMKMVTEAGGAKTEMSQTHTLVEINADKAVIETKGSMVMGGNKIDLPANKRDIPAKVEKPKGGDAKGDGKADVKESSEDLTVGGKKVKCKVTETKSESAGTKTHSKVWMADEIPGHMAKMESQSEGASKSAMTMTADSFEAK
jgi:hypothetical protein